MIIAIFTTEMQATKQKQATYQYNDGSADSTRFLITKYQIAIDSS